MFIKITGAHCISCYKYSQYYEKNWDGEMEPIDCGYCGHKFHNVRPGDRCREYKEKSNAGIG